eukprot:COSAG01_NODE_7116_length_3343_cov_1.846486_3_plen_344_part_00
MTSLLLPLWTACAVATLRAGPATAPAEFAPGFVGVYHSATGSVADGHNSTAWSVGQFGIVAFENSPSDGGVTFRGNIEANCRELGANAVYGMLIAHSEGGTLNNPNDTAVWEPLNLTERGHAPPAGGPAAMLQGAARWSTLARTFCPQIDGVVIDDFWSNYRGGGGPPVPPSPPGPPGRCSTCPQDKPYMYGNADAGWFCCPWRAGLPAHCSRNSPRHEGQAEAGGCCLCPAKFGSEGCQHDRRCGTNPKNYVPCGPPTPTPPPAPPSPQDLNFEHMQDIKVNNQHRPTYAPLGSSAPTVDNLRADADSLLSGRLHAFRLRSRAKSCSQTAPSTTAHRRSHHT